MKEKLNRFIDVLDIFEVLEGVVSIGWTLVSSLLEVLGNLL